MSEGEKTTLIPGGGAGLNGYAGRLDCRSGQGDLILTGFEAIHLRNATSPKSNRGPFLTWEISNVRIRLEQ